VAGRAIEGEGAAAEGATNAVAVSAAEGKSRATDSAAGGSRATEGGCIIKFQALEGGQ